MSSNEVEFTNLNAVLRELQLDAEKAQDANPGESQGVRAAVDRIRTVLAGNVELYLDRDDSLIVTRMGMGDTEFRRATRVRVERKRR